MSNHKPPELRKTLDMRAYMKEKNATRRARAIETGICTHCNYDPAREGKRTCAWCGTKH